MSSVLLKKLRDEELEHLAKAKKLNDRRRRVFKSWFKRNLWRRFTTHTKGMETIPWLPDWLYTKILDDTFRGSPKDAATSKGPGEHGYGPDTRLSWSNTVVKMGLDIVLDSRDLLALFVEGHTINVRMLVGWIEQAITEAVNELVDKYQPDSPYYVTANVRLPKALLSNLSLQQLLHADLTIGFVPVNR